MTALPSHPVRIRYGPGDDLLAELYVPVLERAVRYDRLVGLASADALARAAAGLDRLIRRGGSGRWLCGVRLTEDDVARLDDGEALDDVATAALVRDLDVDDGPLVLGRLAAVAWMLDHRHLDVRLALPLDSEGRALTESDAQALWTPEEAVVRDAEGHRLAWSGGDDACWTFASYPRGGGAEKIAASPAHVHAVERRFEALWRGRPGWHVVELPASVRERLLAFLPEQAPRRDPLERAPEPPPLRRASTVAGDVDERLLFRFLREVPFFPGARDLGVATSAVVPWPHQLRTVRRAVARYPESLLFADEVGLGKTIEAALALRQLLVAGRVRRALILVPRNLLRQWQEELYEKAALHVPRFTDGRLYGVDGRVVPLKKKKSKSPWDAVPVLLASSHLARRREHRAELLRAAPWDLVIVDEAHHARRRDAGAEGFRPNRLLELLGGRGGRPGLRHRTRCLYLLTATPMQVHPVEVWDLLRLLGLGGRWGASEDGFLRYFEELRRPFERRDWGFLAAMLADHLEAGGAIDPAFRRAAAARLGDDAWARLETLPSAGAGAVAGLGEPAREVADALLRRHTPLASYVERGTRRLLRRYRMQGLLTDAVPERRPENVWIPMSDAERELYERIETYLADYYRRYEAERRGLGFVMTVYRRRLTSSFYAVRRSLERRRAFLRGEDDDAGLTADDLDAGDREPPDAEVAGDHPASEEAYLDDFLRDLGALGRDSKVERLLGDVETLLAERDTALVFTQYTDTMDHLRDELRPVYGARVACYSGRGGERWDGAAWTPCRKEEIKEAFRRGDVRLLLCSDSASEGLNLQTCGVLVNFDMPWNPMRVEQRIGRVDRIGQTFREVWIRNYFYADTVEAEIYRRLAGRIRWFEEVLGRLQPILHRVGEAIERIALLPGPRRARRLEEEVTALAMEIDQPRSPDLGFDHHDADPEPAPDLETPVTLADLEAAVVGSRTLGPLFAPDDGVAGAYRLRWQGEERAVTFQPEVFDRYPDSTELLTWGHPLFDELLRAAPPPAESTEPRGLGLYRTAPPGGIGGESSRNPWPLAVFVHPRDGRAVAVGDLDALRAVTEQPAGTWTGSDEGRATALFSEARQRLVADDRASRERRRRTQERALVEAARGVLRRAALVALAAGQRPGLFEDAPRFGFGPDAVAALRRRGAPFAALLDLVGGAEIEIRSDDPYFLEVQGRPPEHLERRSKALVTEGKDVVARHALLTAAPVHPEPETGVLERVWLPLVEEEEPTEDDARPFRVLEPSAVRPFANAVPLYDDLTSVADRLGDEDGAPQDAELENPADYTWVEIAGRTVPSPGLFVARVEGEAMNRRIPSGAWCVFRLAPARPRDGQVVLARHRDVRDPELGGTTTLRVYENAAQAYDDGTWEPGAVLRPASTDASFQPFVLRDLEDGGFRILAELVEVLG